MEATNGFKGLNLIDRMPEELRTEIHDMVQEVVTKTIPKKKICNKAKCLSEEGLQIAEERSERQSRKEKLYPTECRVPNKSKE